MKEVVEKHQLEGEFLRTNNQELLNRLQTLQDEMAANQKQSVITGVGSKGTVAITVTDSDAPITPRSTNSPDSKMESDVIERRMAAFKLQLKQAQKDGEELR